MSATVKRLGVPFRWSAQDGLGANGKLVARSYRSELEGVLTRAGQKWVLDRNGMLVPVAHSVAPFARVSAADTLLLEKATTNYLLYSQDFSNAAWSKTNVTVTVNAIAAPDGTLTADKIEATASAATLMRQVVTTIASTQATFAVYVRQGSGATEANKFAIYNDTTAATIANVTINYATGAVTASSGVARAVQLGSTPWWRLEISALTGITSGNDLACYPCFTGASETAGEYAYIWQADLTPDATASSPIPTTSAVVARAVDALYFPVAFVPQALTAYVRGTEQLRPDAAAPADSALLYLGASAGTGAGRIALYRTTAEAGYRALHQSAAGTSVATAVGATAVFGDTVEARLLLSAAGAVSHGVSINGGTEEVAAAGTAYALDSAFGAARLYLNAFGSGSEGAFAYRDVVVALGTKTMAEMRALAEAV